MAVPLYVFLGFLEAGKTSFIQELSLIHISEPTRH